MLGISRTTGVPVKKPELGHQKECSKPVKCTSSPTHCDLSRTLCWPSCCFTPVQLRSRSSFRTTIAAKKTWLQSAGRASIRKWTGSSSEPPAAEQGALRKAHADLVVCRQQSASIISMQNCNSPLVRLVTSSNYYTVSSVPFPQSI